MSGSRHRALPRCAKASARQRYRCGSNCSRSEGRGRARAPDTIFSSVSRPPAMTAPPRRPPRCSKAHTTPQQRSPGHGALPKAGRETAERLKPAASCLLPLLPGRWAPPPPEGLGSPGGEQAGRGGAALPIQSRVVEGAAQRVRGCPLSTGGAAAVVSRERQARAAGRVAALARAAAPDPTWRKVRGGARAQGRAGPRPPAARGAPPAGVAFAPAGDRGQPLCRAPIAPLGGTDSALPAVARAGCPRGECEIAGRGSALPGAAG